MDELKDFTRKIIALALEEDLGEKGDITSRALIEDNLHGRAQIVTKEEGIIAGLSVASSVFAMIDETVVFNPKVTEGAEVKPNQTVVTLEGRVRGILAGERVALNFLSHLSGIATFTRRFVEKAKPFGVIIRDTRKTLPGLRMLEKHAVRVGGGENHRFGLYDGVLIKDNHIKAVSGVYKALEKARENLKPGTSIEIEAKTLEDVEEALRARAEIIMLDNMDLATLKKALQKIRTQAIVEVSGGITLENIEEIARLGVKFVSVGAITQSAKALDLSLNLL